MFKARDLSFIKQQKKMSQQDYFDIIFMLIVDHYAILAHNIETLFDFLNWILHILPYVSWTQYFWFNKWGVKWKLGCILKPITLSQV